ncbi:MAG: DUF6398 domain-containing protein [Bacteroidales bacterium]
MSQKELLKKQKFQLIHLISEFCEKKLDEEHKDLASKVIYKLYKKNALPLKEEDLNEWAAGIIHAIGSVNLLFDKSFEPYISEKELFDYYKADQENTFSNSEYIKNMLKLNVFDPEYSTHISDHDNPLKDMVSIDGIYISLDLLPSYLSEKLREVRSEGYMVDFRSDEI